VPTRWIIDELCFERPLLTLLVLKNVSLRFGDDLQRPSILEDLSLEVGDGEFVTILGPSGCGKTSLLRLAAGFQAPTEGEIYFDGERVAGPSAQRVVVFQQAGLYPWLKLRDNVAFGLKLKSRRIDWALVDQTIEIVGLSGYEKYAPYELSGGMQQRAALARALVMAPRLLLMDEPFGALDALTRQRMQEFTLELRERLNLTIVFITHDVEEAILLGDRMLIMQPSPGRISFDEKLNFPRPRSEATTLTPEFQRVRQQALETLGRVAIAAAGFTGLGELDETAFSQAPQERAVS
jgi:NitT/TauT family transport system ATP-binding protein